MAAHFVPRKACRTGAAGSRASARRVPGRSPRTARSARSGSKRRLHPSPAPTCRWRTPALQAQQAPTPGTATPTRLRARPATPRRTTPRPNDQGPASRPDARDRSANHHKEKSMSINATDPNALTTFIASANAGTTRKPASSGTSTSWYEAMAKAWGDTLDGQAGRVTALSDAIANGGDQPSNMVQLTAESLRMQFISNNAATSQNAVGHALETLGKRQ